jgi:FAD/FMN-containing dehydrogenase
VIAADDPAFDEAREIYNAMHERRPAVVVEPEDASGVAHVVEFARSADVPLAVRGGGHSIPGLGSCDDGVMLSLRTMTDVKIDPERRIARVEGGAIWGQVNDAAHEFGLATPGGLVTHTGVGGFTTGGGFGLLSRAFGLACDNLTGAQVVTADGSVVECGPDREADLFWAIRGGGGNFGVVTRFDFRLHPVRDVVGGLTVFPLDASVIEEYLALIESTPKEFNAYLGLTKALPAPFLPEDVHGTPVAALLSCWSGPAEEHVELLNRITCLGPVLGQQLGPMPYPVINTLFDEILPFGLRHYWKSLITRTVPPQSIATYVEHGRRTPNSASGIFLHPIDGACHDVAAEETAWSHRDADWLIGVYGSWHEEAEDESGIAWVRESHAALKPFSDGSEYVNFAAADDSGAAREIYGSTYPRLAEVKGRYDPDNVFRLNQNVSPSPPRS